MKNLKWRYWKVLMVPLLFLIAINNTYAMENSDTLVAQIFQNTKTELSKINATYHTKIHLIELEINRINKNIRAITDEECSGVSEKINGLIELEDLKNKIEDLEFDSQMEVFRVRYRNGIELIKMIYEKVLGLDHHFTSLQTFQNVSMLSNPNSFPEFSKAKDALANKVDKKQALQLPSLLESNPFVSMTFTLVSSFLGGGSKKNREEDLSKIACILDFTVRMNTDLNIVYYETEFLKENNRMLKEECLELFKDYTKVIGYKISLQDCRKEDDWEVVFQMLDDYIKNMEGSNGEKASPTDIYKQQVNIVFSIDRLMQFMDKYTAFISSGEKYYQKFQTILNNYSNEDVCQSQLPHQFSDLKKDIEMSILKFNEAYNISELQGSKLKDLMYGVQD